MNNLTPKETTVTKKVNLGNYENIDVSVTFEVDANNPTRSIDNAIRYVSYMSQVAKGHNFLATATSLSKIGKANLRLETLKLKADAIIFNKSQTEVDDLLTEIANRYKVETTETELDELDE